jgi:hypothetical protein
MMCIVGAKNGDHTSSQNVTLSLFFEPLHKAKVSMKKDWCFGFYTRKPLQKLPQDEQGDLAA